MVYVILPSQLRANRKETTRAQMIDAHAAIDRQLKQAAQPLGREQSDLVIAALEQDGFGGGDWARVNGRYPKCATRRALDRDRKSVRKPVTNAEMVDRLLVTKKEQVRITAETQST